MLVNTKAKVGVFSIALGAYLPQFPSLVPEFEAQYDAFKKTIPDTVEIVDGGMVTTKEQAMVAGDEFRAADVDLVFLQMLTYATSYNIRGGYLNCSKRLTERNLFVIKRVQRCTVCAKLNLKRWRKMPMQFISWIN